MPLSDLTRSIKEGSTPRRSGSNRGPRSEQRMQTESPSVNTPATILQGTTAETPPVTPIIVPELPKVAFTPLAEEPLKSVVQTAGMVWVGTDSNKLAEVQNQIQAENPAPRLDPDRRGVEPSLMLRVRSDSGIEAERPPKPIGKPL